MKYTGNLYGKAEGVGYFKLAHTSEDVDAMESTILSQSEEIERLKRENLTTELELYKWQERALKTMLGYIIISTKIEDETRATKVSEGEGFLRHAQENITRLESELTSLTTLNSKSDEQPTGN
jgi:hypothetical protein